MTNRRPHLFISEQLPTPLNREYDIKGGSGTFPRDSYQKHANKIYHEASVLKQQFEQIAEFNESTKRYFRVELPEEQATWTGIGKILKKIFTPILSDSQRKM